MMGANIFFKTNGEFMDVALCTIGAVITTVFLIGAIGTGTWWVAAIQGVISIYFIQQVIREYMAYRGKNEPINSNDDDSDTSRTCRGCGDMIDSGSERWMYIGINDGSRGPPRELPFCESCTDIIAAVADKLETFPRAGDYK